MPPVVDAGCTVVLFGLGDSVVFFGWSTGSDIIAQAAYSW